MGGGFGGFGGDRGDDRYPRRVELPLPTKPPYTAHVGNLSFDATEEDISIYFQECNISSVRLVRDRNVDRPKGFGYVEFHTLEGLKKALDLNNGQLAGRNVRVSVADPPKDRQDDRTNVDTWRRAGPLPPSEAPQMRRQNSRFNDNSSDAGGDNFSRRGSGFGRSERAEEGDGKFRDFNNWERKGPLPPPTPTDTQSESGRPPRHERGDRRRSPAVNPFDRERQPSLQGDDQRSERGDRPRRDYQRPAAPERAPTAAEKDNEWRRGARPDVPPDQLKEQYKAQQAAAQSTGSPPAGPQQAGPPRDKAPPSGPKERYIPPPSPGAPQTRPKLELKKRSENLPTDANQPAAADSKSNPFGGARPIDTTAREREVEEKRARQIAEKKAKEEKAKEEKKAAAQAARAEKAEKGDKKGKADATGDDANAAEADPEESTETKEELKQTKAVPKVQLPPETATKPVDDEGWSTVKRGRGTNGKV
ncbi:hypothetical protein TWF696_000814 [Orbilia brochopaga]|uniref:RRM domain-containing protein n=1 Tax=Orbilia brochopaga TaxID=3140254 RepID=A0AAV9VCG7_9PEZI